MKKRMAKFWSLKPLQFMVSLVTYTCYPCVQAPVQWESKCSPHLGEISLHHLVYVQSGQELCICCARSPRLLLVAKCWKWRTFLTRLIAAVCGTLKSALCWPLEVNSKTSDGFSRSRVRPALNGFENSILYLVTVAWRCDAFIHLKMSSSQGKVTVWP